MKARVSIVALLMTVMVLWSNVSQAQYRGYQSAAGVNVGASLISMLFRAINYADDPGWKSTQIPTIQGVYDYRVSERFSVGGAASFSHIAVDYNNADIGNVVDNELQNFTIGFTRINVGARGLFYYTTSDVFELYSGLRLGVNIWNIKVDSTDPDFAAGLDPLAEASNFARAASPGLQVIGLGANIYPVENVGINFEFAIGQPYFAAIGMRYRF
jgi:hypothetical protein